MSWQGALRQGTANAPGGDVGRRKDEAAEDVASEAEFDAYLDDTEPLRRLRGGDFLEVNVASLTHQIEVCFAQVYGVDAAADGTFTFTEPERPQTKVTAVRNKGKVAMPRESENEQLPVESGVPMHWNGSGVFEVAVTQPVRSVSI